MGRRVGLEVRRVGGVLSSHGERWVRQADHPHIADSIIITISRLRPKKHVVMRSITTNQKYI